jgi:transketolase
LKEIELFAAKLRFHCLLMSHLAETAHLAGALSCADLLAVLYGGGVIQIDPKKPQDSKRDRLIFSKGHAVSALYAALAMKGFFPEEDLENYNEEKGHLPEQPSPGCAPGVEWATGSLGHGLGVGLGMALAAKIHHQDYRTFVLMSDGPVTH